jgi:hypothetical protein
VDSVCPWSKVLRPRVGIPEVIKSAPKVSSSDIVIAGILAAPVVMEAAPKAYSSLPAPAKVEEAKGLVPNIYCSI